jgi:hypothetical protein
MVIKPGSLAGNPKLYWLYDNVFSDMNISYVLRFLMVVNNIISDLCFPQS